MPLFRNPFARSNSKRTTREPLRDEEEEEEQVDVEGSNRSSPVKEYSEAKNSNNNADSSRSKRRWFRSSRRSAPVNASLFCGFCDMRIATILLNVMHMIFSTLLELFEMTHRFYVSEPPLLWFLALLFSGLGVLGAMRFNLTSIFCSTLGLICLFVLYLAEEHMIGMAMICVILYSHVVFICEMKKGIMTQQTYEEHQYMDEMGQEVLQKASSYASDVGETTKDVVLEVKRSASNAFSISSSNDKPKEEC